MGSLFPGQDPPPPLSIAGGRGIERDEAVAHASGSLACATLQGETVVNAHDEELGSLEHVVIDLARGRIAYAVLVRGGVFGLGERLHAFRWDALEYEPMRQRFLLDVDKSRLDAAPGFDDDHWPAMTNAAWASAADSGLHKHRPV
jgi:hypothetical protein